MIYTDCPNHDVIRWIIFGMLVITLFSLLCCIFMEKVIKNYEHLEIQNKVFKRDLELNTLIKHEHIQKLLCPHDLLTFNDEHIYTVDKCSICNKQCKKACWAQYFIDKLKEEQSTQ